MFRVRVRVRVRVTLAGYCSHSTLVPAIVPKTFFAPSEKIHMKKLFLSNGRGVRWKEGKARYMIGYKSTTSRVSVVFFLPSVCVFLFFCFGLFGVGGVLQCSASPTRCRIRQSSLSCTCSLCLPSLNSLYFSFFFLAHAGIPPPPPSRIT